MRVLWASSSVGKGHVVRDLAVVGRLQALAGAEVDWLVPDPGGDYLRSRGQRVLDDGSELACLVASVAGNRELKGVP